MAETGESAHDIQAKVLQTTLTEISSSRQTTNTEADDCASPPLIDCCVICLDSISEPCTALPCTHAHFDFLCLVSWLQERATCPLCKSSVYKVRYQDAKAGESIYSVSNSIKTRDVDSRQETQQPAPGEYLRRRRLRSQDAVRGADRHLSRPGEAVELRRHVYRHELYSLRTSPVSPTRLLA